MNRERTMMGSSHVCSCLTMKLYAVTGQRIFIDSVSKSLVRHNSLTYEGIVVCCSGVTSINPFLDLFVPFIFQNRFEAVKSIVGNYPANVLLDESSVHLFELIVQFVQEVFYFPRIRHNCSHRVEASFVRLFLVIRGKGDYYVLNHFHFRYPQISNMCLWKN